MRFAYWWLLVLSVLSLAALTWAWHITTPDGIPFGRSGAFVTILSLTLAFLQYAGIISQREKLIIEMLRNNLVAMGRAQGSTVGNELEEDIHAAFRRTARNIAWWQGLLIFIGTVVWGFGDLIYACRVLSASQCFWKLANFGA